MKYFLRDCITELLLKAVVFLQRDSGYIKHCRREVPHWFMTSGPNRWMADGTEQLLAVLSHQGHSGGSIGFAIKFFSTMASFKPWGPLTGEEHEWSEPFDSNGERQNKRCGHVFLRADGTAYDSQGRVFKYGPDTYCISIDSCVEITFPYDVPEEPIIVEISGEAS